MQHDFNEFIQRSHETIGWEYRRISARSQKDPGTAGDNGEENWAALLRECLPSYFKVVTKGVILDKYGHQSPQLDVLVLCPSYPNVMLGSKYYLKAGVVAAFECKLTLRHGEVQKAVETAASIKKDLTSFDDFESPFKSLHSQIYFGLLAHSHSWKGKKATPLANIQRELKKAGDDHANAPRELIDSIIVADLAAWVGQKSISGGRHELDQNEIRKVKVSGYISCEPYEVKESPDYTPIGRLIDHVYEALSWRYPDMNNLSSYLSDVVGVSRVASDHNYSKEWDGKSVFSADVLKRIESGECWQVFSGEWSSFYFH